MKQQERLNKAFEAIEKLKDRWDSYNGISPSLETIEASRKFCKSLNIEIEPNNNGSVVVYFGDIFGVEVLGHDMSKWRWFVEQGDVVMAEGEYGSQQLERIFK